VRTKLFITNWGNFGEKGKGSWELKKKVWGKETIRIR